MGIGLLLVGSGAISSSPGWSGCKSGQNCWCCQVSQGNGQLSGQLSHTLPTHWVSCFPKRSALAIYIKLISREHINGEWQRHQGRWSRSFLSVFPLMVSWHMLEVGQHSAAWSTSRKSIFDGIRLNVIHAAEWSRPEHSQQILWLIDAIGQSSVTSP